MKNTINTFIGLTSIIACVAISTYILGYNEAEIKHLKGDIKIMSMMADLLVKTHESIDKNKNNEEETEEE